MRKLHDADAILRGHSSRCMGFIRETVQKEARPDVLRLRLGDDAFWAGIQFYMQTYFGKSVTTSDFQAAFERATGRALSDFFQKWVY